MSDLEAGIIPDAMLVFLIPVAIGWRWSRGGDWLDAAQGGALALSIFAGVGAAFRAIHDRDGLGFGDVKFAGLAGIYVGLHQGALGWYLVASSIVGILFGSLVRWRTGKMGAFPYGPSLCASLMAWLMWESAV